MASVKTALCLGLCLCAGLPSVADTKIPKAENVRWVSLDFKTILTWTTKASNHTFTVLYSWNDNNWQESLDCIRIFESECDLTNNLEAYDRAYSADVKTEPVTMDYDYEHEDFPHSYTPQFNPYRDSNISAVKFTVEAVDDSRVRVNITDPSTSLFKGAKQLSIRDIFRNNLKYKISYWKSGSTGKRDTISNSNTAEVSELDAGLSYCFMVAAFIPSRPRPTRQGAWSKQQCTETHSTTPKRLSAGVWAGVAFSLLTVLAVVVTASVLVCRQRHKPLCTGQRAQPV